MLKSLQPQNYSSFLCIISFTGQRILTWDVPETKEAKTSRFHCQQGSATNPGSPELTHRLLSVLCTHRQCINIFFNIISFHFCNTFPHPSLTDSLSGSLSSPHKEVDNFVLSLVKKDGIHGSKWWITLNTFACLILDLFSSSNVFFCANNIHSVASLLRTCS